MRLRTKLIINAVTIIVLPLILISVAFFSISSYMKYEQKMQITQDGTVTSSDAVSRKLVDEIDASIKEKEKDNPNILEDTSYLDELSKIADKDDAFIVVRKGNEIYYNNSEMDLSHFIDKLPEYGFASNSDTDTFIVIQNRWVSQVDFEFSDGSNGSLFIIFSVKSLISPIFLTYMCIAMALIMIFTSLMLTGWIRQAIVTPISELSIAMQKIKNGDFEYHLPTNKTDDEIGEMYSNYEDMRLRLKESAEEKIEHEQQNKELISNISHDLKTPITAIKGYSQGLIEGVADTKEKQMKYIKTIYNKANDMNNLINELTLYSSIDNNRIPYNFHKMNLGDYFRDCVDEVGIDLESKSIKLNYSNFTAPDTEIIADPEQLKRVVNNIISNSVKYLNRDDGTGQIDIRVLDEVDSVRVEIEDNGKGIAQKDIASIFDRFYRTVSSRNSKQGGNGIGLSIVKKIIEDHGGYIWATSHEGEGTCMHFVLRKYFESVSKPDTDTTAKEA